MNHVAEHDTRHPFSPAYIGEEIISLKKCDVCEIEMDENLTATVKEADWTICVGCLKMVNIQDEFPDSTSFELESILKQLKPIM